MRIKFINTMALKCHFPFRIFFTSLQHFLLPSSNFLLSFSIFLLPFSILFTFLHHSLPPFTIFLLPFTGFLLSFTIFLLPFRLLFISLHKFFTFFHHFFTSPQTSFYFPSDFFLLPFTIFPSKHSSWWRRLEDVFKTSFVFVFRRRLDQDEYFRLSLTSSEESSRRLQDVLVKTNIFVLAIRLQDVFKTSSRRFEDVFKTSSRRLAKMSSRRIIKLICSW